MHDVLVSQSIAATMLKVDKKTMKHFVCSQMLETSGNGGFERLVYLSSVFKGQRGDYPPPVKPTKKKQRVAWFKTDSLAKWRERLKRDAVPSKYKDLPYKALSRGYWVLLDGQKRPRVKEHRYVIQQHLGKKIKRGMVVHHKNRIKTDNDISNLQIMTVSEHARLKKPRNKSK